MVKYALISDIHGNEVALNSVLKDIGRQKIKNIICLGDIVGYGPRPHECLQIIQKNNITAIIGNHDASVARLRIQEEYSDDARVSLEWTSRQVTPQDRDYLKNLPYSIQKPGFAIFHGSPFYPEFFDYVIGSDEAFEKVFARIFRSRSAKEFKNLGICFMGHTHSPSHHGIKKSLKKPNKGDVDSCHAEGDFALHLAADSYHLINCGSVGQPRDDDSRACYVTFDSVNKQLEYHRVIYDIEEVKEQIFQTNLPRTLAWRLEQGR